MSTNKVFPFRLDEEGNAAEFDSILVSDINLDIRMEGPFQGRLSIVIELDKEKGSPLTPVEVYDRITPLHDMHNKKILIVFRGETLEQQREVAPLIDSLTSSNIEVEVETDGTTVPLYEWARKVRFTVLTRMVEDIDEDRKLFAPAMREINKLGGRIVVFVSGSHDVRKVDTVMGIAQCSQDVIWVSYDAKSHLDYQENALSPLREAVRYDFNFLVRGSFLKNEQKGIRIGEFVG